MLIGLVALCLALGAYVLSVRGDSSAVEGAGAAESSNGSALAASSTEADQTEQFLDAFEASFAGPYAITGVLEFSNEQAATRQVVRRARIDDRSLDQVGGGALVTRNGELRRCSDDGTQFLCTDPEPAPSPSQRRAEMATDITSEGGYMVSQRLDGCYVLTAKADGTFSPLGFETTYCFDSDTGAVAAKITIKGRRTESFVAEEIKAEVTEEDLTPI